MPLQLFKKIEREIHALPGRATTADSVGSVTQSCPTLYDPNCFFFSLLSLFLAVLSLRCCAWGLLFVAVHRLLISVASLVVEHGLWGPSRFQ